MKFLFTLFISYSLAFGPLAHARRRASDDAADPTGAQGAAASQGSGANPTSVLTEAHDFNNVNNVVSENPSTTFHSCSDGAACQSQVDADVAGGGDGGGGASWLNRIAVIAEGGISAYLLATCRHDPSGTTSGDDPPPALWHDHILYHTAGVLGLIYGVKNMTSNKDSMDSSMESYSAIDEEAQSKQLDAHRTYHKMLTRKSQTADQTAQDDRTVATLKTAALGINLALVLYKNVKIIQHTIIFAHNDYLCAETGAMCARVPVDMANIASWGQAFKVQCTGSFFSTSAAAKTAGQGIATSTNAFGIIAQTATLNMPTWASSAYFPEGRTVRYGLGVALAGLTAGSSAKMADQTKQQEEAYEDLLEDIERELDPKGPAIPLGEPDQPTQGFCMRLSTANGSEIDRDCKCKLTNNCLEVPKPLVALEDHGDIPSGSGSKKSSVGGSKNSNGGSIGLPNILIETKNLADTLLFQRSHGDFKGARITEGKIAANAAKVDKVVKKLQEKVNDLKNKDAKFKALANKHEDFINKQDRKFKEMISKKFNSIEGEKLLSQLGINGKSSKEKELAEKVLSNSKKLNMNKAKKLEAMVGEDTIAKKMKEEDPFANMESDESMSEIEALSREKVNRSLASLKTNFNDVNTNENISLWQILSSRYLRSAVPVLLKKKAE